MGNKIASNKNINKVVVKTGSGSYNNPCKLCVIHSCVYPINEIFKKIENVTLISSSEVVDTFVPQDYHIIWIYGGNGFNNDKLGDKLADWIEKDGGRIVLSGWSLFENCNYCPGGRLQKEHFQPFQFSQYTYGDIHNYNPQSAQNQTSLFMGIENPLSFPCRHSTTTFPPISALVSQTYIIYDFESSFKCFGFRKIGKGFCFGLNIPSDKIPEEVLVNTISLVGSLSIVWSKETHKYMGEIWNAKVESILLSFARLKSSNSIVSPPRPIVHLIIEYLFSVDGLHNLTKLK